MAAPEPILRVGRESSVDGIEVHVVQLLVSFLAAPNIEIVEAPLPETAITKKGRVFPQAHLPRRSAFAPPHGAGNALLEYLHNCCGSANPRFGDQEMNMLGHDDVSEQREVVRGLR